MKTRMLIHYIRNDAFQKAEDLSDSLKCDFMLKGTVIKCRVVFLCFRGARERWRPHHHLPRVLRLQRSARGRLPQCSHLPDQHPQVHMPLTHIKLHSHSCSLDISEGPCRRHTNVKLLSVSFLE